MFVGCDHMFTHAAVPSVRNTTTTTTIVWATLAEPNRTSYAYFMKHSNFFTFNNQNKVQQRERTSHCKPSCSYSLQCILVTPIHAKFWVLNWKIVQIHFVCSNEHIHRNEAVEWVCAHDVYGSHTIKAHSVQLHSRQCQSHEASKHHTQFNVQCKCGVCVPCTLCTQSSVVYTITLYFTTRHCVFVSTITDNGPDRRSREFIV